MDGSSSSVTVTVKASTIEFPFTSVVVISTVVVPVGNADPDG
jgi:hypothetical protein